MTDGACHLCALHSIFERWWVLIRGRSDYRRGLGGQGGNGEFFIRPRSFSAGFSSAARDPCVQHKCQEEQEDDAYAHADNDPGVPAAGSVSIMDRRLVVVLSQGEPYLASEA